MMNKRKFGALIATIALIAAIAIGGTLAYFTDKDENTNVVKMGHVDITLTETSNRDKDTVIDEKGITFENVLPGDTLSKVPTIAVENGSADCYVRVQLTFTTPDGSGITQADLAQLKASLIAQITEDGTWAYNEADDYFYCTDARMAGDTVDLFQSVTVPAAWQNNVADQSFSIGIKAEAIQASYISYDADNINWADANGVALTGVQIQEYAAKQ